MAELVYAPFLNSGVQQNLWVRFPLWVQLVINIKINL